MFDPFAFDPLLHPLSDDWSSLDRSTSLSLTAEPPEPEEEPWPYNNALHLFVDPAMYVSAWDAGGIIRATASPSLNSLYRPIRQRSQTRSIN